ncbi:MAG: hypothetical protein ACRCXL_01040 [Dermatophilaceae bacterium]
MDVVTRRGPVDPEMAEDVAAYRAAKAEDDGTRVSLDALRDDSAS